MKTFNIDNVYKYTDDEIIELVKKEIDGKEITYLKISQELAQNINSRFSARYPSTLFSYINDNIISLRVVNVNIDAKKITAKPGEVKIVHYEPRTYYALQRIGKYGADTVFISFNKYEVEYVKEHIAQKGEYRIVPLFTYTDQDLHNYIVKREIEEREKLN